MSHRSLAIGILLSLIATTGLGCKNSAPAVPVSMTKPVTLQYWGVFTDTDDMAILIKAFNAKHPKIQIEYRKFRPEEYDQQLIQAFAEDRGPDLFSIHNNWLRQYINKLSPMPPTITYAVFTTTGGGVNQTTVVTPGTVNGLTQKQVRDLFVPVVEGDVMAPESATSTKPAVYALPFYVDSLAMYFNRDIMAQNGITPPAPMDWETMRAQAEKYSKPTDQAARAAGITQSIVAMGTGASVHASSDLLAALMLQSGAPIGQIPGQVGINLRGSTTAAGDPLPGVAALGFYLDFSNPEQKSYTWNPKSGDSLEAFTQGRVAYYFGYSYDLATIRARNPRLNFDIAPLPVPKGVTVPISIANYWMEAVAKKSQHKDEAWLFILETATQNKDALNKFLPRTKRASALNEIVQTQLEDPDLGVFARQNLTAKTWYHGRSSAAADLILSQMIDSVRTKLLNPPDNFEPDRYVKDALDNAATRINDTL